MREKNSKESQHESVIIQAWNMPVDHEWPDPIRTWFALNFQDMQKKIILPSYKLPSSSSSSFLKKNQWRKLGWKFLSFMNQIPFRNPTSQKTLESETIPPPCRRPTFQLLNKTFFQGILSSWRHPGCHYHCTASSQQKLGLVYIHPYLNQQQIKWLTNCKHNKSCSWKQLRYCV